MRILYLVSYYKPAFIYGGGVTAVAAQCENLVDFGVNLTVLTTNANGRQYLDVPVGQPVEVDGVEVHYYPVEGRIFGSYFYSPQLVNCFREKIRQFDLAIIDALWTHALTPAIDTAVRQGVPCVVPLHGQLLPWALRHRGLKKRIYLDLFGRQFLDRTTALQCASYKEMHALLALNLTVPAFIVPYGLKTANFAQLPTRGTLRSKLRIPHNALIMLFVGRLHQIKNPKLALETLISLQRRDVHLVFVGPDEETYVPKLRLRAQQAGYASQVHFTGLLSNSKISEALADADLFIMPSATESFGMALVEAMASGVPVLLSEDVPIGRWVMEAGAGRVVPCNIQAFTQAAAEMLSEPEQLKSMSDCGRLLAQQQFDISIVTRQMLLQYQAIINNGKPLST
jgi:glycosyltransferase involved in cell wall biosynthesis